MSLREVIRSHFEAFSSEVSPVELASSLRSLTPYDLEIIACRYRSNGRLQANLELFLAICSKVDWKDFYEALMKGNYHQLAKSLHEEYYKQNPTAQRIVYNEPLESQVAEGDANCAEFIPEVSSSNEKISPKIHLEGKINVSSSSCNKDSTTSKSQPLSLVTNNYYNISIGVLSNSNIQVGDENQIIHDRREESMEEIEEKTTYEIETVSEVLENPSSSEIDTERSPDHQNTSGRQLVEQQSIADDASQTSNLPSTNNSSFRSAARERTDTNGSQALLKTSVTSEIERLGINFRHNEHSEGENHADDSDDETYVKKTLSDN